MLGLNSDELNNAIGIAATQASGLMEVTRGESVIKPLQPARAAQSGVLSALLAQKGLTAPESILDGENGFLHAYSDGYNREEILKDLGRIYRITEVYFKFHASCRHTHAAIDAVLALRNKYNISSQDVREVEVKTYSAAYEICGREYSPKTVSAAKFSIPYCVAVALIKGHVSPEDFTENSIRDEEVLTLAQKVRVTPDPDLDKLVPKERGAKVRLLLSDGESFEISIRNPYGEPEVPPRKEDIENKFKLLATTVLPPQNVIELMNLLKGLDKVHNIRQVLNNLYTRNV